MKILVTGGAGFIGSNLVDGLIEKGHEVLVVDNLSTGKKENINKAAKFIKLDIRSDKLKKVFDKEKPEIVYHLAAQLDITKSIEHPVWDAEQNILGSINLLENCKNFGVKKIIFSSTAGVYGDTSNIPTSEDAPLNPPSPYGIGKLAVEKYLEYYFQTHKLPYIVLRYANVYGPRQISKGEGGVVAIFIDKFLKNDSPTINGDGIQTRDYVYVSDVVDANLDALISDRAGIFNIGTTVETDVNTLADIIKGNFENTKEISHGPALSVDQKRSALDNTRAKNELRWQPNIKLEEGIKKTIEWFRKK